MHGGNDDGGKEGSPSQLEIPELEAPRKSIKSKKLHSLLQPVFIKEVYHPDWLANLVLVRKKNNEWRMCVDYTDLNKHYP
jgi:hypothetical protein